MKLRNLFLCCLMTLLLPLRLDAKVLRVPDTLEEAYVRLRLIVNDLKALSESIESPADYESKASDLEIVNGRFNNLMHEYPQVYEIKDLSDLYKKYMAFKSCIDKNIEKYQQKKEQERLYVLSDSIHEVLQQWEPRFEILLQSGKLLAEQKKEDSLQIVKNNAEDYWNQEVNLLYLNNKSLCESDSEIKTSYENISSMRSKIRSLIAAKEEEKTKIGDYIFKIILVLGVATMAIGIIASQRRSSKLRKQAEKGTSIDL